MCTAGLVVEFQELGADLGIIDFTEGVFVEETFAGGAVIGAEPGVGLDWRAVDVPGEDVGRNRARFFVARDLMRSASMA